MKKNNGLKRIISTVIVLALCFTMPGLSGLSTVFAEEAAEAEVEEQRILSTEEQEASSTEEQESSSSEEQESSSTEEQEASSIEEQEASSTEDRQSPGSQDGFYYEETEDQRLLDAQGDFFYEEINGNYVRITGYNGAVASVEIPSRLGEYTVQEIGNDVFYGNTGIEEVTIPGSVVYIGSNAFRECTSLKKVNLAEGLEEIGKSAFEECAALSSISFPESLEIIGNYTFYNCSSLSDIAFSEGLIGIGEGAFAKNVLLKKAQLPDSVNRIGNEAFQGCESLAEFHYPISWEEGGNRIFAEDEKLTEITVPEGVAVLASRAFMNCENIRTVHLPETLTGIGKSAFEGTTGITSIDIPESVTEIGAYAFYDNPSITEIRLPDGVTRIEEQAFAYCPALKTINYPLELMNTGAGIFENDESLTEMTVPEGVTELPDHVFRDARFLEKVNLPSTLSRIGRSSFEAMDSLLSIEIPESVTEIGAYAFYDDISLTEITLPDGITRIGEGAFAYCSSITKINYPLGLTETGNSIFKGAENLKSITVPEGVTKLPKNVFRDADQISSLILPDSLTEIGRSALEGMVSLVRLSLPENVEKIDEYAFYGCTGLKKIRIGAKVSKIPENILDGIPKEQVTVYGTAGSEAEVWANTYGFSFIAGTMEENDIVINGRVTDENGDPVENVRVSVFRTDQPEKIYYLSTDADGFWRFEDGEAGVLYRFRFSKEGLVFAPEYQDVTGSLEEQMIQVTASGSASEIPDSDASDFTYATLNARSVEITGYIGKGGAVGIPKEIDGKAVTSLKDRAFYENTEITEVRFPSTLTKIGKNAFRSCTSLTNVIFSTGITSIGASAFEGCTALTSIRIPGNVTKIESYAFYGCSSLIDVQMEEGVKEYGERVFAKCTSLERINYPLTLESCGNAVFEDDEKLTEITVPEGVKTLAVQAFRDCKYITEVHLPSTLLKIGRSAFEGATGLTSIDIPESVTEIDNYAFYEETSLTEIRLPDGVTRIGEQAFSKCRALQSINYPKSLTETGAGIFKGDESLTEITVPEGVTVIPVHAFREADTLKKINLPSSLTKIGRSAFENLKELASIDIPDGVTEIDNYAFYNNALLTEISLPDGITRIGEGAFAYCSGLTAINYPLSLAEAGADIFKGDVKLKSMTVPEGVTALPDHVFRNAEEISSLILPKSLTKIGRSAMEKMTSLVRLSVPDNVTTIGNYAFYGCKALKEIWIGAKATNIPGEILNEIDPAQLVIHGETRSEIETWAAEHGFTFEATPIGGNAAAFSGTVKDTDGSAMPGVLVSVYNLTNLTLDAAVLTDEEGKWSFSEAEKGERYRISFFKGSSTFTPDHTDVIALDEEQKIDVTGTKGSEIPDSAASDFTYIKLAGKSIAVTGYTGQDEKVGIPAKIDGFDVVSVGDEAFRGKTFVTGIRLPDAINEIGTNAFRDCTSLSEVILSAELTSIKKSAFENCKALKKVRVPEKTEELGNYVFYGCSALEEAELPDGLSKIGEEAFANCTALERVNYPLSLSACGNAVWKGAVKLTKITVPEGVRKLADQAFKNCTYIKEVHLPSTLQTIGKSAFEGTVGITALDLPDTVTEIGAYAFYHADSLADIELPDTLTTIGEQAFAYCASLEQINYPAALSNTGRGIFKGAAKLKEITIPEGVTALPANVFYEADQIERINLPSTLKKIGKSAFEEMASVTSFDLPEAVTEIDSYAFYNLALLRELTLPDTVTTIGEGAFAQCRKLESLNYPLGVQTIGRGMIEGCENLRRIMIPEGVTSLPQNAFRNAQYLRYLVLPQSLTEIGDNAFEGCIGLPYLTLPDSLQTIGDYAFWGCDGLLSMEIPGKVTEIRNGVFGDCDNLKKVYMHSGITKISDNAFERSPVCLIVSQNSYACAWAIEHNVPFEIADLGEQDSEDSVLDMDRSSFYTNTNTFLINKPVEIFCDYTVKEGVSGLKDQTMKLRISDNLMLVPDSVKTDGVKCRDFAEDSGNNISIPLSKPSGRISFFVNITTYGRASAYAEFQYKKDAKINSDMVGALKLDATVMTIETDEYTAGNTVSVSGITEPGKKVSLLVNGENKKTVYAGKTGIYTGKITLADQPVDGEQYLIRAEDAGNSAVFAETSVIYQSRMPVLTKFDMYYMAHKTLKLDLLSAIGTKQTLEYQPGNPLTFFIHYDNAADIDKVFVVSTKSGQKKRLRAEAAAKEGDYIATGYFDEKDPDYLPGNITVEYSLKTDWDYDPSTYTVPDDSEMDSLPDELKPESITENRVNEYEKVLDIRFVNGETGQIAIGEYDLEGAFQTFLDDEDYQLYLQHRPAQGSRMLLSSELESLDVLDTDPGLYFIQKFEEKYKENIKEKLNTDDPNNPIYLMDTGGIVRYLVWDSAKETFISLVPQGATFFFLMNHSGYSAPEMWGLAGSLVSGGKLFLKALDDVDRIREAERAIRNNPDIDQEAALERIASLRWAYAAAYIFDLAMLFARPYLTAVATAALGPVGGLLVGVAISLLQDVIHNYLDDALAYYASGGKGIYLLWLIDPSGYVYETVTTNRLEGAVVTAYFRAGPEESPVIWDAEEYDQINPIITDESGLYAWDTPEGQWQVVVEKEGYRTWRSEWLPVPPVQTDVNASMIPLQKPGLLWGKTYEDGIELKFDQYIDPDTMKGITVKDSGGSSMSFRLEYSDQETDENGKVYADTFFLRSTSGNLSSGKSVTVRIPAGLTGSNQELPSDAIEVTAKCMEHQEMNVTDTAEVDFGGRITIPVTITPAGEADQIYAVSGSDSFVKIISIQETDTEGLWNLTLEGKLPGQTTVETSLANSDIRKSILVTVKMNATFEGYEEEEEHVHSAGKAEIENVIAATCTEDGRHDEVIRCAVCKEELSRVTKTDPAFGHDWGEWKVTKEATETMEGEEIRVCRNDPSHVEKRALDKKPHVHTLEYVSAKPATLKTAGNTAYYKCSGCGKLFSDKEGTTETTQEAVTIPKLISIKDAAVTGIKNKTYTGKVLTQSPKVVLNGKTLKKNTDYKLTYKNNKNAGKATVTITGIGKYGSSVKKTFSIGKAANTITNVKTKYSKTLSYNKNARQVLKLSPKVKGSAKITYRIGSIRKGSKIIKKGFTVTSKGEIRTAKKLAKGTYTVQVKIAAAEAKNYKAKTKTVTLTVKIK